MKAIFRKCEKHDDMIEIITKSKSSEKEFLWAVVHEDFLYGEGDVWDEYKANGEIIVNIRII
jgi:hypothetical protein